MASPVDTARSAVRWGLKHGISGAVIRSGYRHGDVQSRLFLDPATREDPYPTYREIRDAGPFLQGRLTLLTARHATCSAVLRSDAFGVGFNGERLPPLPRRAFAWAQRSMPIGPVDPPSMLAVDAPDHTRYRRLVSKVFTARAVESLRPMIEERCSGLLDGLAAAGDPVDLVSGYCSLLPVTVITEILGVPVRMREQFLAWGAAAAPTLDIGLSYRQHRRTEAAIRESNAWMRGHFRRLREAPGDDLLSRLVHLEDGGDALTDDEVLATSGLLLAAGFETTVNLLGTGSWLLRRHPDQLDHLLADPLLWRNAVEEALRYDAPVQTTGRLCRRQTEIDGRVIPAGAFVVTLLGGANRDPEMFTDPDAFDVRRPNAREHLAFSSGAHYCMGAALARLEGEIGLRALFRRFPQLELAGAPRRRSTRVLRGFDALPVRLVGGSRAAQPPSG